MSIQDDIKRLRDFADDPYVRLEDFLAVVGVCDALEKAQKALKDIAKQKYIYEMDDEPGDLDYAYDAIIQTARKASGEE